MNTPNTNQKNTTTNNTATSFPTSNYRQPNRCLVSTPREKDAESNYLVKYITKENIAIYFWMTKSGEFLKMSNINEWNACCKNWKPRPTAVLLPVSQEKNAAKIEAFINECESNKAEISKATWDKIIADKKAKSDAIKADAEKQIARRARIAVIKADVEKQYTARCERLERRKQIDAAAELRKSKPVTKKVHEVITEINQKSEPSLLGDVFGDVLRTVKVVKEKKVKAKKEKSEKPSDFKKATPKKRESPRRKVA